MIFIFSNTIVLTNIFASYKLLCMLKIDKTPAAYTYLNAYEHKVVEPNTAAEEEDTLYQA